MSTNQSVFKDEQKYIARTQKIPYYPIAFEKGDGALLYDFDGNKYIDFLASACSANLGHGNVEIADAVYEQMKNLTQYTLAYFNSAPPVQLAESLCEIAPIKGEKKVLYSATGSASIDAAIKIARAYTKRSGLISMQEAYHGSTFGAISISALSNNMRKGFGPLIPDVHYFSYPSKDKDWKTCIKEMEYAFVHYLPPEEVAAIFIEPIAGDAGIVIPPKEWVQALREMCDQYGILLVVDEIQQALCRTGKWFAIENFDVEPDLIVMGKSVGGGLPLGAVIGKTDIMNALEPPAHLFTLAGNTTVCTAGQKNLEILKRIDANELSIVRGEYLKNKFESLKEKYDFIGEIRGLGLSIGVDIIDPETGGKNNEATAKICYYAIKNGLLMIFLNQSTLRVQPPLVIQESEIDEAMQIINAAMNAYANGEIGDEVLEEIAGW